MTLPATSQGPEYRTKYTYDGNGNLTGDGWRTFEYDFENQLTNVYVRGQWRSEFAYDAMMRRRVRREYTWSGGAWVKTNEVRYVYDRRLVIQERDANNLSLVTYTRGKDLSGGFEGAGGIGGMLARTDNRLTGVDAHSYYHFDGNGNVVSMINTNGTVVARYSYDPFGNILAKSGPLADVNLYRFSSKEYHPNSGLVYYLYRYYDPNLQRWVNRDPIQEDGGFNLYGYVENNSVNDIDPFGLERECGESFNDCRKRCLEENYGSSYDIALDLSYLSIPSLFKMPPTMRLKKQQRISLKIWPSQGPKKAGQLLTK
ncbi:MAG TPA: RHS repeat-associated core domain-containing protein [Clostridia bacterium]|nr:RHS repeat-associated core domain-containing protein [Clostridia bacterium]